MNSDPNAYRINGEFASSGNDNSVILTLNVPSHAQALNTDNAYTTTVPAPSKWLGKQMRALITINLSGAVRAPSTYVMAGVPVTYLGSPAVSYAFIDVTRISSGEIQLRARTINHGTFPGSITFGAFTVEARVRTVIGN